MKPFFGTVMMAATLAISGAAFAGETSQQRVIDARAVKIKLDGIITVHIKQGATPSLTIIGEQRMVEKVSVVQSGDTLSIGTSKGAWHFGNNDSHELRAELILPYLNELVSSGVGSSEVNGFSGKELTVSLDGAGAVTVNSNYKNVVARLGGVGSMTLNSNDADQIDLKLRGAGAINVKGSSKLLRATLGGVGSLNAKTLTADTVVLDMSGLGGATVYAKNTANLKLSGLGSATVFGNPATRTSEARGLGSVSWE